MAHNSVKNWFNEILYVVIVAVSFFVFSNNVKAEELSYESEARRLVAEELDRVLINDNSKTNWHIENRPSTPNDVLTLICQEVEWQASFDEKIGTELVNQLSTIPTPILQRFYQLGGHICIVPRGSLGSGLTGLTEASFDGGSGLLLDVTIYLTATTDDVKSSTSHEFGHFVYNDIWGYFEQYYMLQYSLNSANAMDTARAAGQLSVEGGYANNYDYLLSDRYEYFAGVFSYVCFCGGSNPALMDTLDMMTILQIYCNYLNSSKIVW